MTSDPEPWNQTERDYPRSSCVHELFEIQATATPNAVAVVFGERTATYRELNERADTLAEALRSHGAGPETLVGLCLHRSIDMVAGLLAVLKAGAAYVPIDPHHPVDRIAYVLADSCAGVLLTERSLEHTLRESTVSQIQVDAPLASSPPRKSGSATCPRQPSARDLAYVIYTSGSTGRPKGVAIEHRSVVNFLHSMRREPGLASTDTVLAVTTLSFDIAVLEILLPLTTGARVVVAPWQTAVDGNALVETLHKHGVTLLQATPATWRLILAAGWQGTPGLKALCGGEPLPPDLARDLLPRCSELWNMYGPTETTIWSTCARIHDPGQITVGRPIANTTVQIVDTDLRPVAPGTPGELLIGGDGLARGYLNRPELTTERFLSAPAKPGTRLYRTGDLARLLASGEIECLGRLDSQVKIRGFRIELGEIETVLSEHPGVQQAVVAARDDPSGEKRLVAYLVAKGEAGLPLTAIRELVRAKLPDYMRPSVFMTLPAIPLTPNGKIDRRSLPTPEADDLAGGGDSAPPATATERTLSEIWQRLLAVPAVGRHDDFFELGGTSLLAAMVFSGIERSFRRRLPLSLLFDHPTLSELAAAIDATAETCSTWSSLVSVQPKGTRPPLFVVHGAGGNVLLYRSLAARLGDDQPLFGFQARGLDGISPPLESIEAMASAYVGELRHHRPEGPYFLGGYCLGGAIALEMARRLVEQGAIVPFVALFDTYNPSRIQPRSRLRVIAERAGFHVRNFLALEKGHRTRYLREKIRVARDGELRALLGLQGGNTARNGSGGKSQHEIQEINDRAFSLYRPKPFAGRLLVFKPRINYSAFPEPDMGWNEVTSGTAKVIELPINPHAMLVEPFVLHLAEALRANLAKP